MSGFEFIGLQWNPVLCIAGVILLWLHLHFTQYNFTPKTALFGIGLILAELALALPMGPAPGQSLFSLHMLRHILLLMIAPPFLVSGLPKNLIEKFFNAGRSEFILKISTYPVLAWILGVGIMWFWHAPPVFNGMMTYDGPEWVKFVLMACEIISLLLIGMVFCSPILFPLEEYRLPPLKGIVYLFTACWGCSLLGILITFASPGLYQTIFSSGSQEVWGLTQQSDQQLGGLLMWVPGCVMYVSGAMVLLARWYSRKRPVHQTNSKQPSTL